MKFLISLYLFGIFMLAISIPAMIIIFKMTYH